MDSDDLWEVTVVPSLSVSQATFSNNTIIPSRTLSTISERESKQDFCLPFDENERIKKDTYRNVGRSKITSLHLSPTCQKFSHDSSHHSFKSDKPIVPHGNKKDSHDRTKDKVNKDIHSQIHENMNNASTVPFIELEAIYKILDFITDSDSKVSLLTNNCCNEILRTLQCLLIQRRKKLEDLLSNDSSLRRCEHCGVISCTLESHSIIKKVRTKTRLNDKATVAKHDCINDDRNNEKSEILSSPSNLINNVQSRINDSKVNDRNEYTDELTKTELSSINERASLMKRYTKSSNETNKNVSVMKANINATVKNKLYLDNNTVENLFADLEREKKAKRYECNSATRNNPGKRESCAIRAYADIGREEVVREILYEPKSQIDDSLARNCSYIAQEIQALRRLPDKHGDIYPLIDTVKYLARGQITELDRKENELLSKLQEGRYTRPDDARNVRSSVLYGSREDYSQRDAGFWLFDKSGRSPQITLDYRYSPMPRIDNNRENVGFPANISRYSHTIDGTAKGSQSKYMEKDSLEDCALLDQRKESNATILSSSSVENLIYESLDGNRQINNIDDEDIPRGRQLVSSRPSLDIARHVRAQIAKDRHSGNAKESIGELYAHNSDIFGRLSPETRKKIYHLIKAIISDKNSTLFRKKYLINNALNGEKLLHSKSADAAFAHSNKTDSEMRNICMDDIPTKLSNLPESKNRSFNRQDNFSNTRNHENLNKSKDSVKICYDNNTASVSAHNFTKKIVRQIIYKDALLKDVIGSNDGYMMAEILPMYRKILENSENMDWESFREFVEVLHPDEKELWRDVCRIISEEARRISSDTDDNTEIRIEIGLVNPEETLRKGEIMTCSREIVFELDMTLKKNFFNKRFAEESLDTHKDAEDITGWSNDGR